MSSRTATGCSCATCSRSDDPAQRVFGTVAIREGYEVGDHGAQSVYRVGCVLQLTEVDRRDDGTFDIVAVARERLILEEMQRGIDYPQGLVAVLPEPEVDVPAEVLDRARATFTAFRVAMTELQGDPFSGTLPRDPDYLAWTLSALAPLPMAERQSLLEAEDATERLDAGHPDAHRGAPGDQRHPVAAGHPGGPHRLVPQLSRAGARDGEEGARRRRYAGHGRAVRGGDRLRGARLRARLPVDRSVPEEGVQHARHAACTALEAAEALGVDPARVFKTLLARWTLRRLRTARRPRRRDRPGDGAARPQGAGARAGWQQGGDGGGRGRRARHRLRRRRHLAGRAEAPHRTVLDASALEHGTILVSGGRRGFDLELAPADLVAITGAVTATIGR